MQKENGQQGEENGTERRTEIEEEMIKDSKSGGEKKRGRQQGQVRPWREVTLPHPANKIPGTWVVRGQERGCGDFPGPPVVKTPPFHCRVRGFNPWPGN